MPEEKELCGAPHPWMPHRVCQREKGHAKSEQPVDPYYLHGIVAHRSTHADYAGSWQPTRKERKEQQGG